METRLPTVTLQCSLETNGATAATAPVCFALKVKIRARYVAFRTPTTQPLLGTCQQRPSGLDKSPHQPTDELTQSSVIKRPSRNALCPEPVKQTDTTKGHRGAREQLLTWLCCIRSPLIVFLQLDVHPSDGTAPSMCQKGPIWTRRYCSSSRTRRRPS